jgi:uncharacterized small protein (DUF1192 family)
MNQSRKTRQPDRFMLYMTLMLLLWVVVFVVVLFNQAGTTLSDRPPATVNTPPETTRNPFSGGQFASHESTQFLPRPRRLEPLPLPAARAYTTVVFGDMLFTGQITGQASFDNPDDIDTQNTPATFDAANRQAEHNNATDHTNATDRLASRDQTDTPDHASSDIFDPDEANINIDTTADNDSPDTNNNNAVANTDESTPANTVTADDVRTVPASNISQTDPQLADSQPEPSLEIIPDINTPTEQADIPTDRTSSPAETTTSTTDMPTSPVTEPVTPPVTETVTPTSATPTTNVRLEPPPLLPSQVPSATSNASSPSPIATPNTTGSTIGDTTVTPTAGVAITTGTINVTFTSQPSGAEIILDDEVLGLTPLELSLPAAQDIFYTLAMPSSSSGTSDFRRFSSVIRSAKDTTVAVRLEPISNLATTSIEGFGTTSALRGNRANAQVVRDAVAALLEQATSEYQAAISDRRVARLQAEINALEAELTRLDAILTSPEN